ncbi:MAG: bifunctional (p)ppGpp synthetase/guanosine-3',5'-bis(diphosphate) 3'-pyrophosphohydrolase [Rhizobiales bacterium]|nr:bifunctional (p)ppGpp synthetase/guanosine-3',5'-bis(diphosphate) 3'-pyrophosphohydrolase [Hyphomicrobiales bacterium]
MMRQYELVDRVRRYNPATDEGLLDSAYVYAMKAHGSQVRASGDPYFSHPLEVAAILTDLKLDDATIVAALLHDTIEDTKATRAEISKKFGKDIATLVEGLTKIKKLDLVSKRAAQAENLRKLLLAIADDVRVLLVKLADRLHNMRTLKFVPEEKRNRIAEETLDIYAPLAGRMGMHDMREELEDLSFRQLQPDVFRSVEGRLAAIREKNAGLIKAIEEELTSELRLAGTKAKVRGREKRPYSIWRKMERKAVGFEQLSDLYGFRVVVATVADCYKVIGIVHTKWPFVPGRFKDYISTPKQNDYRSLHTTVVGPGRQRVELQIRTNDMEQVAEYGIAAHALYKDSDKSGGAEILPHDSNAYAWLRRTIEMLAEGSSPEEFLEHTKLELFHDQVFCFTPNGRLIALPRKATPIDFAYAVHTDVGNSAIGCKINGQVAPLVSELQTGDEVEIIRSDAKTPPAAWDAIVITGKARAAIRRATRSAVRKQYTGLGRKMVERAFAKASLPFSEDKLQAALPRLARPTSDDLFSSVGRGEIKPDDVLRAVDPEWRAERVTGAKAPKSEGGWFGLRRASSLKFRIPEKGKEEKSSAIPIRGINGELPVRFAPNGGAVPGDRIVGILNPGEGITIYPIHSPALKEFDDQPERWLDVRWDVEEAEPQRFPAQVGVTAKNEPGSLAQVASVIGEHGGNIDNIRMGSKSPDFTRMVIDVEVFDLKHLNAIIAQLRAKKVVSAAERVNG